MYCTCTVRYRILLLPSSEEGLNDRRPLAPAALDQEDAAAHAALTPSAKFSCCEPTPQAVGCRLEHAAFERELSTLQGVVRKNATWTPRQLGWARILPYITVPVCIVPVNPPRGASR